MIYAVLRSFADGQIFGEPRGDGPPQVLALHGWRRTHQDFASVLGPADGHPALPSIALDLPGFGASPPPPAAWGAAEYAAAVAPVLDEMARPVVVLGHSFGGRVAVHLAAAHPSELRGLVLTGVPQLVARPGRAPRPAPGYRAWRTLRRAHLISGARMEAVRRRYGSEDYRQATGVMRDVLVRSLAEEYSAQLQAIACPTVLVWGARDTAAPLAMAERAVAMLQWGRLDVLPGVGHLTPREDPAALRAAVMETQQ